MLEFALVASSRAEGSPVLSTPKMPHRSEQAGCSEGAPAGWTADKTLLNHTNCLH